MKILATHLGEHNSVQSDILKDVDIKTIDKVGSKVTQ